ncbi:hypothetical protein [Celeribacter ethanolicus]|uniref:hypothetical protein n=1 Tax=Celeribacter ethanolicus TaxID=1758178 RepID=UPI000AB5CC53|nr:hypothetical protein [Celeribacter ethanolicus]TNE63423.1 MAG: hypothetical protein EP336_17530 [Paracoccaceae bacterium]
MPILLAVLGVAITAFFYMNRARNAANAASDLIGMADDLRLAVRRFGFTRKSGTHPVEQIEDARIAVAALVKAVIDEAGYPTSELILQYVIRLQKDLDFSLTDAEEIKTLADWLIASCNGSSTAITRLARKLYKLAGSDGYGPVEGILHSIYAGVGQKPNAKQLDSLAEIRRLMRAK